MEESLIFEINDGNSYLRIEPVNMAYPTTCAWAGNWIKTKVAVKCGIFSGEYFTDIMTVDFELLKRSFRILDKDFGAGLRFEPLERQIFFEIKGDGLGNFDIACEATENPSSDDFLTFSMTFDQTALAGLIRVLEEITARFPIIGDYFKLKNE